MRYIICLLILSVGLFSCKKGDEDPFFSLRTRKARLVNTWKLTEATGIISEKYTLFEIDIMTQLTYDGEKQIKIKTENDNSVTDTSYCKIQYKFNKNNTYEKKMIETIPGNSSYYVWETEEGKWDFLSRSRKEHIKNKEHKVQL